MCLSGRELTEPRPSPDGSGGRLRRPVGCIGRADGDAHRRWPRAHRHHRPAAGAGPWVRRRLLRLDARRIGGRCTPDAMANSGCSRCPAGLARRVTSIDERPARRSAGDLHPTVGSWSASSTRPRCGAGGSTAAASGRAARRRHGRLRVRSVRRHRAAATLLWQAWNVPHMPWDRSRVEQLTFDGAVRERSRAGGRDPASAVAARRSPHLDRRRARMAQSVDRRRAARRGAVRARRSDVGHGATVVRRRSRRRTRRVHPQRAGFRSALRGRCRVRAR